MTVAPVAPPPPSPRRSSAPLTSGFFTLIGLLVVMAKSSPILAGAAALPAIQQARRRPFDSVPEQHHPINRRGRELFGRTQVYPASGSARPPGASSGARRNQLTRLTADATIKGAESAILEIAM